MPIRMPLAAPVRTIESIGQVKVDRVKVPNFVEYVPASEWNNLCDELIATAQLALNLAGAGASGVFQQTYNNGLGPITQIVLDSVRNGIVIADANPSIGSATSLFSVQKTNGFPLFDIANDIFQIATTNGGISTTSGRNGIRMTTDGGSFFPSASGQGDLGASDLNWNTLYAGRTAHGRSAINYASSPVFNAALGSYLRVVLTGDITDFSITNLLPGQVITCIFKQDGTGGRRCTGTVTGAKLKDGLTYLPLTAGANGYDAFVFARNEADGETIEIGRKLARNPETAYAFTDLSAVSGAVNYFPWIAAHTQHYTGTLGAAVTLNLKTGSAYPGMRFRLVFDETTGVTTDATNTLTIAAESGASLVFNQTKTLRGVLECVFGTGNIWYLCKGNSLSYA